MLREQRRLLIGTNPIVCYDYYRITRYVLVGKHTEQHVTDEDAKHEHRLGDVGQLELVAHQIPL